MAVLPLEASVTVGRTVGAQQRSGFIESQERLTEEVAVGITWLFGVRMMQTLFDRKIRPHLFPKHDHLRSDTAWDVFGRLAKKSVDLLPSETETLNAAERKTLRRIQAARLGFSTVIATLLAALIIPMLNKKKTDWLMHSLNIQQRQDSPAPPSSPPPKPVQQPTPSLAQLIVPPAPMQQPVPPQRVQSLMPVRFGKSLASLVQPLGHLVDQTTYGALLVIDLALSSGRAYVYGKRSPIESIEIGFRDAASVYFYLFSTPHAIRLMAAVLDRIFKSSSLITPQVGELLRREFLTRAATLASGVEDRIYQIASSVSGQDALLQHAVSDRDMVGVLDAAERIPSLKTALNDIKIDARTVRRVLHGYQDEMLISAEARLKQLMQQADRSALQSRLQQTLSAYGISDDMLRPVIEALNGEMADQVQVADVQRVLKDIRKKQGDFAALSSEARENLSTALKLAFRQEVGERLGLGTDDVSRYLQHLGIELSSLSEPERNALIQRVQTAARRDSLDEAANRLRRQMNVARAHGTDEQKAIVKVLESLANWTEASSIRANGLHAQLSDEVDILSKQLRRLQPKLLNVPPEVIVSALEGDRLSLEFLMKSFKGISGRRSRHLMDWLVDREQLEARLSRFYANLYPEVKLPPSVASRLESVSGPTALHRAEQKLLTLASLLPEGQTITPLLSGQEGRLFSLATSEGMENLAHKASGIVRNGLVSDAQVLTDALLIKNQIPLATHVFSRPKNAIRLRKQMTTWMTKLQRYVATESAQSSQSLGDFVTRTNQFTKLGRNLHYPIWLAATGFSLWGLGVLVPKAQMLLTYILTGRNEHPGLKIKKAPVSLPQTARGLGEQRGRVGL